MWRVHHVDAITSGKQVCQSRHVNGEVDVDMKQVATGDEASGWDGLCHVKGGRSEVDDEKQVATGARHMVETDLGRGPHLLWYG